MKEFSNYEKRKYRAMMAGKYSSDKFEKDFTYEGDDLGLTVGEELTFKVWAPMAEKVMLNIYETGDANVQDLLERQEMLAGEQGVFSYTAGKELLGRYYTYTVTRDGRETEAVDPYARSTGVNGNRAMILDLSTTNPEGWEEDKNPHAKEKITDAVIYELHIRDLSADQSSGIKNTGKYLGLTETGTKTPDGKATGIDHIRELGVTHVHLLPFYDYGSIDESLEYDPDTYNWGYDPVNFNVPEGSYATDAFDGAVRVREVKQMVKAMHEKGLSVVMDVVYNHVYSADDFCFNRIVPGYFSRVNGTGAYSSGSFCGNDTASERPMVRKYIVDSVLYWATEYHLDGFRFDLVGLLDVTTINAIVNAVHAVRPDVIFYGEGWNMNTHLTKWGVLLANQGNSARTPEFAYFNDTARDAIKGDVFEKSSCGYVSGRKHAVFDTRNSWLARMRWSHNPTQIVQYVSCHDNYTLFDKLSVSRPDLPIETLVRMNNLAAAICLTAQGIPFFMAGEEMLRTKVKADGEFEHNSYASPDEVNAICWSELSNPVVAKTFEYYKGLIAFRKAHPSLRLTSADDVSANISSPDKLDEAVLAFNVLPANGESAEGIFVIFNPNTEETTVKLPGGEWKVCVDAERAGTKALRVVTEGAVTVSPISAMVLVKGDIEEIEDTGSNIPINKEENKDMADKEIEVMEVELSANEAPAEAVADAAVETEEIVAAEAPEVTEEPANAAEAAEEVAEEPAEAEAAAEVAEETAEAAEAAEEAKEAPAEAAEAAEEAKEAPAKAAEETEATEEDFVKEDEEVEAEEEAKEPKLNKKTAALITGGVVLLLVGLAIAASRRS